MCDLVGNNFERQAVLNPASASPNAAYISKIVSIEGKPRNISLL